MLSNSLVLAERAVPRYTSYPTAPHFHAGVTAVDARAWLGAIDPAATLSLYIHVPFCAAMCAYCGCHTKVTRRFAPIAAYIESLRAEIRLLAAATPARRVLRLHWGGGTPAMLGATGLRQVTEALPLAFDLSELGEHAMELDPRGVDAELVQTLAAIGVTRASLGVQDFDPEVQVAIGRIQPFATVRDAVDRLRDAGITALSLDLIYGLPHQTEAKLAHSLALAHALAPDRLALFGYAHVPWMKKHQRLIDAAALPGAAERLAQARAARLLLETFGYVGIGLDHFARPEDALTRAARAGRLRRNFQGYTDDPASVLLGLGASSIGQLPQGFVQNAADIGTYRQAIAAGRFATSRGLALTEDDRLRGSVIERLMCDFAVHPPAALLAEAMSALRPLIEAGVVELRDGSIALTEAGRPFLRLTAAAFDAHLSAAGRFSLAV